MFSLFDSLTFLLSVRETLCEIVDSTDTQPDEKASLKDFFMNEATDYEVINYFVKGEFPQERYNSISEAEDFDFLRKLLRKDFAFLSEYIDQESINCVIKEVGPISDRGLSSAAPILEFLFNVNGVVVIQEEERLSGKAGVKQRAGEVGRWGAKQVRIAGEKAREFSKKHKNLTGFYKKPGFKKGAKIAGAAVIAAMATFAAIQIYRRKLRPAAKACKQFTGPEKTACMKKFQVDAWTAQVGTLRQGLTGCDKSSDPAKCKSTIEARITKIEAKIAKRSK